MRRILCLWFPNWSIQRWLLGRPEFRGQTVALYSRDARRGQRIVTCCGSAYRLGIRPEMSLAEAQAIVGRKRLVAQLHNPVADRKALETWAARCEHFSPRVALEESDQPESLLLDITGLEHLFGSEENLVAQVTHWLENEIPSTQPPRSPLRFRIAVAGTVGAAWAVSHFAHTLEPAPQFPVIIPAGEEQLLFPLPAVALRLSAEVLEILSQLGIRSIEQVLELPRESLSSRFGKELLWRVDQFTDRVEELVEPQQPLPQFSTFWSLEHPTADRKVVAFVLGELIEQLVSQLVSQGQGAIQLVVVLRCQRQSLRFCVGLFRPAAAAEHLKDLVGMQLENLQVPEPIEQVELSAPITAQLSWRQQDLFQQDRLVESHELALLVNRLSSRLGTEAVVGPQLCASALPERACRHIPLAGQASHRHRETSSPPPGPRPLLLHRPPRPIELVGVAPDGPPQCVWLNGQRQNITQSWGPERIETGWWRGPPVRRDYYRIETEIGSRLWVFRRLHDGMWFLHGEFG